MSNKVEVDSELGMQIGATITGISLLGMLLTELQLIDYLPYLLYLPLVALGFIVMAIANQFEKKKEQQNIRDK
jgi:hypothetical protein